MKLLEEQYRQEQSTTRELFGRLLTWFTFSATINATVATFIVKSELSDVGRSLVPAILIGGNIAGAIFAALIGYHCQLSRRRSEEVLRSLHSPDVDLGRIPGVAAGVAYAIAGTKVMITLAWSVGMYGLSSPDSEYTIKIAVPELEKAQHEEKGVAWVNASYFDGKSEKTIDPARIELHLTTDASLENIARSQTTILPIIAVSSIFALIAFLFAGTLWFFSTDPNPEVSKAVFPWNPVTVLAAILGLGVGSTLFVYWGLKKIDSNYPPPTVDASPAHPSESKHGPGCGGSSEEEPC